MPTPNIYRTLKVHCGGGNSNLFRPKFGLPILRLFLLLLTLNGLIRWSMLMAVVIPTGFQISPFESVKFTFPFPSLSFLIKVCPKVPFQIGDKTSFWLKTTISNILGKRVNHCLLAYCRHVIVKEKHRFQRKCSTIINLFCCKVFE